VTGKFTRMINDFLFIFSSSKTFPFAITNYLIRAAQKWGLLF
jgi:hypothetical protein